MSELPQSEQVSHQRRFPGPKKFRTSLRSIEATNVGNLISALNSTRSVVQPQVGATGQTAQQVTTTRAAYTNLVTQKDQAIQDSGMLSQTIADYRTRNLR